MAWGVTGRCHHRRMWSPVRLGAAEYVIDEVGSEANPNLASLGHVVVYVNSPDQPLLPGAVKASGPELPTMSVGNPIAFVRG